MATTNTIETPVASMREAWAIVSKHVYFAASIGALYNILLLAPSLYTIILYSRVLPSRSVPSLVGMTVLALFVMAIGGALDNIRGRVLARASSQMSHVAFPRVVRAALEPSATALTRVSALRYFDALRQLATGPVVLALTEAPWSVVYVGVAFLINPFIGLAVLFVVALTMGLTILSHVMTRHATQAVARKAAEADRRLYASILNADRIALMGASDDVSARHATAKSSVDASFLEASLLSIEFSSATRALRTMATIGIMGLACYLAITDRLNPALIFAISLILARAIGPFEHLTLAIGQLASARRSNFDIGLRPRPAPARVDLRFGGGQPAIEVRDARIVNPGSASAAVQVAELTIDEGEVVCVRGQSGSGKTTFLLALLGARPNAGGGIVVGGHRVVYGQTSAIAKVVGYIAAEPLLAEGSILDNIRGHGSEVDPSSDPHLAEILRISGVTKIAAALSQGLSQPTGSNGEGISAGEARKVMLARALYRGNRVLLFDELDNHFGEKDGFDLAGLFAFLRIKEVTVVYVASMPANQAFADRILTLASSRLSQGSDG